LAQERSSDFTFLKVRGGGFRFVARTFFIKLFVKVLSGKFEKNQTYITFVH
jgi:hypothetical protein